MGRVTKGSVKGHSRNAGLVKCIWKSSSSNFSESLQRNDFKFFVFFCLFTLKIWNAS